MTKINKSWEKTRTEVHSPDGVKDLRREIKFGLSKKYKGLAESMWEYQGLDAPIFEDMNVMSQDTVPEVFLLKNGMAVWFQDPATDQIHCLPVVMNGGINMYGKMSEWSPVPVGYTDVGGRNDTFDRIRNLKLTAENSVIMKNDLFGGNDEGYIDKMIDELVDNTLTMNQLQLIAKCPFVFRVSEDNMLTAKNFYLAMAEDKPAIFVNSIGEDVQPVTEQTRMSIDPALFELFDRFECQILEYIGYPCVPITKRAQQTVSEVQSNDDKIRMRRYEKWRQRQKACDRINAMFGTSVSCVSLIDGGDPEPDGEPDADSTGEEIKEVIE